MEIIKIILGIVALLLGIGILYLMVYLVGRTGLMVRRGFALNKVLMKAKMDITKKGFIVNKEWVALKRRSFYMIGLPIVGWSIVYLVLFFILPSKDFLYSLFGLILVFLGFFGILFGPGVDAEDFF